MTLPQPFAHPGQPYPRRHGPAGYSDFRNYKPWLRDEYTFRCVYCLTRETWYPSGADAFAPDHLLPRSRDRSGLSVTDYDNLLYTCCFCNAARRDAPVLNPDQHPLAAHLRLNAAAEFEARTPEGADLIDLLHLNDAGLLASRKDTLRALELMARYPDDADVAALFLRRFGFPDDLPDLRSLVPPAGNRRPAGLDTSYFHLRGLGRLPHVY